MSNLSEASSPTRTTSHRFEKIANHHLQRLAIVYVRQSTQQQVLEHRESTARQYRPLLADADGLYYPSHYNDRLLLGLKGTMSEAELHILKSRLQMGMWNKAERGDIINHPPVGYIRSLSARDGDGDFVIDPDEQVRSVVRLIFETFSRRGSLNGVLRWLVKHDVKLPISELWQACDRLESQKLCGEEHLELAKPDRSKRDKHAAMRSSDGRQTITEQSPCACSFNRRARTCLMFIVAASFLISGKWPTMQNKFRDSAFCSKQHCF